MTNDRGRQLLIGGSLVAAGLVLTAAQVWPDAGLDVARLWPIIIIVMGANQVRAAFRSGSPGPRNSAPLLAGTTASLEHARDHLADAAVAGERCRRRRPQPGWGLSWLLMGSLLLLHTMQVISVRQSWPLFLVAHGIGLLAQGWFEASRRAEVTHGR